MSGNSEIVSKAAIVAAAAVGVQVGAATVASRYALREIDPLVLGALRYAIGALSLLPVLLIFRVRLFSRGDLLPITALGLIQFALLITLFNWALMYSPSARVALVFASFPILTMIFAWLLGREQLHAFKIAGLLLTFAGVAVVLGKSVFGNADLGAMAGDFFALGAAACGAVCSVLFRPYVTRYAALTVGIYAMAISSIALGLAALAQGAPLLALPSPPVLLATVFVGLSSGAGFWALLWAYSKAPPTRVAVFQALAPIVATVLGVVFLDEPLEATLVAGLVIVCAGIVLAHMTPWRQ